MQNGPSSNADFDRSSLDKGSEGFGAPEEVESSEKQELLLAQKEARIKAQEAETTSRTTEVEAADELLGMFEDGGDEDKILDMFAEAEEKVFNPQESEVPSDELDMFSEAEEINPDYNIGLSQKERVLQNDFVIHNDESLGGLSENVRIVYEERFNILKESGKSQTETVSLLLAEFSDKPELADQVAILQKFQNALQLPPSENIPETDQSAITKIFEQGSFSLDKSGLDSFARTVESDETLSVETKQHVLKNLGVEMTVKTGEELNDTLDTVAINPKTGKPEPVFNKNNPVKLQTGIEAYVNENGDRVITVPGKDTEIVVRDINGLEDNGARKMMRLALFVNNMRPEEAFLLTGERQIGETDNIYSEETIRKVELIMDAFLPNRMTEDSYIPQDEDLQYFRDAMNFVTHEKSMGRYEIQQDLIETGVIKAPGEVDRDNIQKIGSYLRTHGDRVKAKSEQYHGDGGFDFMKTKPWDTSQKKEDTE